MRERESRAQAELDRHNSPLSVGEGLLRMEAAKRVKLGAAPLDDQVGRRQAPPTVDAARDLPHHRLRGETARRASRVREAHFLASACSTASRSGAPARLSASTVPPAAIDTVEGVELTLWSRAIELLRTRPSDVCG